MSRAHVVVSEEVLQAIDARVGPRGRSRFIEQAAQEKLERLALQESVRATSGLVNPASHPQWAHRESTREWVRRGRRAASDADEG